MKRLCVFLDGTWQRLHQTDPTNIAKLAQSVAHSDSKGVEQVVFYNAGVGARSVLDQPRRPLIAGITGDGLEDNLTDAYSFLSWNYTTGDEIFVFGFSRGAFTARSLCGMIRKSGLLHRVYIDQVQEAYSQYRSKAKPDDDGPSTFRRNYSYDPIPIAYIGLFDTVGQLGVPAGWFSGVFNRKYKFHDLNLSSRVKSARQACAIDEDRRVFPLTPWTNLDDLNQERGFQPNDPNAPYQQRWFPGGHGEVGGGSGSTLSNITLCWVAEGAARAGLSFKPEGCPLAMFSDVQYQNPLADWTRANDFLSLAGRRQRMLKRYTRKEKPTVHDIEMLLSDAALKRWRAAQLTPRYRPRSLKALAEFLDQEGVR
jgi:uncharacterized protein (DUF2235 family)